MNDSASRLSLHPGAWAQWLAGLTPWRRRAAAALLGFLAVLALPPIHVIPLLWISFPGLLWLIDSSNRRGAFEMGWWFGFAHFSAGLYWIAYSMLVDPLHFAWMIPFAVFGLGGVLAIFTGLVALAVRVFVPRGLARVLALAAAWTIGEWLRGHLFTGFPWNLLATVWLPVIPVAQLASVTGAYGLSLFTVLVAAMPAMLGYSSRAARPSVIASLLLLAVVALWGWHRVPALPMPSVSGVKLRLVQANVAENLKWQPELRVAQLRDYLELSRGPGYESVTTMIWPETASPFFLVSDPAARAAIAQIVPQNGYVITGAPTITPQGVEPFQIWNSVVAVDHEGNIEARYDKAHLVPFGEYVPLRGILPLAKLTAGGVDFTPGPGPRTLSLSGLPSFGPLVCYEIIFPGAIVDESHRPSWLVNVTNDGWFGLSAGPYQHFAAARLRTIEEGLPLARAANTGISAVVDPYGRIVGQLGLGKRGVLDSALPEALPHAPPYAQFGDKILLLLLMITIIIISYLSISLKLRSSSTNS